MDEVIFILIFRATTGGGLTGGGIRFTSSGSGGSGDGFGTGRGVPAAPTIPLVAKTSDWIMYKKIKVRLLEGNRITAEFMSWKIKFERYLKFSKVSEV